MWLVLLFIIIISIGVPIAFSIGIVSFAGILTVPAISELTVPLRMFNGLNSFVLLAVPLFILAATLMNSGKISEKLISFSIALIGHVPGGLAHANVLVSMIFAGVSGSAQADTAGVGKVLIPSMLEDGYDKATSVGVTAASSTIGVIIPPSIPMVIFAGLTNASVGALFLGGVVPGILIGLTMMLVIWLKSKRVSFPTHPRASKRELLRLFIESFPALLTPLIIIGGILTGWYTPTEAAAFASMYAFLVSWLWYRTIKLKDLPGLLLETLKLSCMSLFALAAASALGELLAYYRVSAVASAFFQTYMNNRYLFLGASVLFFLFLGTFMDAIPAMILFVPVLLPTAMALGINTILYGLITVITLAVGLVTPPYGLCLLIASNIGEMPIEHSFKAVAPFIAVVLVVLLLLILIPNVILWLPSLIMPGVFA